MNSALEPVTPLDEPIADTIARDMRAIVVMLLHAGKKTAVLDSALLFWDQHPEETALTIQCGLAMNYGIGCKTRVVHVAGGFEPTIRIRMIGDIIEDRDDGWDAPLLRQLLVYRRHAERRIDPTGIWRGLGMLGADGTKASCISCQRPL